ncbi:MAG: pyruvate formate lyase-activating protein [Clostridia bacterium]|nr:pyruvate formate lyase-activating protein [Clostridia bacterium]
MKGYIHSIQSLGTVDGPGVRFVVFLQGCPLRCGCCHNPDTWEVNEGQQYSALELVEKAERFREYFGKEGGITLSGGEPLLQAAFAKEIFGECRQRGINTCLDTSGCLLDPEVKELLEDTDRVLLDIKYTDEDSYQRYVGCSWKEPLAFLEYLNEQKVPVTLRQVIIPGLNDTEKNIRELAKLVRKYPCIDKTELLPFRKMCEVKYDAMKLPFRFASYREPTKDEMEQLEFMLDAALDRENGCI